MQLTFNHTITKLSCYGIGALLCLNLLACSSDTTVHEVEEPLEQIPMQFGQAAVDVPLTRAAATRAEGQGPKTLAQGFLVSCYKGSSKLTVMNRYEVKYETDPWENESKWGYVGKTADGFWQDQVQRYWDQSAFPYQFYAISPCPAHGNIENFELSKDKLIIPEPFKYQTCNNETRDDVKEPYYVAAASYSTADRVALPFRHIMSKVRFGIYSSNTQLASSNFNLSNVKVKVVSDNFVIAAGGYTASTADIFNGKFTDPTIASTDDKKFLLQTDKAHTKDLSTATDKDSAYFAGSDGSDNDKGLLQIPQKGVKLMISFDINSTSYSDIPIVVKNGDSSFDWAPNNIYTYYINISDLSPLTIEFSAQLSPWTDVEGANINTNLEK